MNSIYTSLMTSLKAGNPVMIDGATGTEVERRGVPRLENAWNTGGILTAPDIVRQVHEDYIRTGAQMIIANTFATHRNALEDAGAADSFEDYNRIAVEIACQARANLGATDVLVAGGMSYWSWTGVKPALDVLQASAVEQASILADAGADVLMLEMMIDIDRMTCLLEATKNIGLPVWVGVTCALEDDGTVVLRNGETLRDAITRIREYDIPVLNIMHTDVSIISPCIDEANQHWDQCLGVYAHSGRAINDTWVFDGVISPLDYAANVRDWRTRGVTIVGGCCGVGPDHMRAVAREVLNDGCQTLISHRTENHPFE